MNLLEAMRKAKECLAMYKAVGTKHPAHYLETEFAPQVYDELRKAIKQAEKQKPVAWWNPEKDNVSTDPIHRNKPDCVPLYTAPPQRGWVSLTNEDMHQLRREGHHYLSERDFRAVEAKLKEKNHG